MRKKTRRSYKLVYAAAAITAFLQFLTWEGWKACAVLVFGILITCLIIASKGEI